MTATCAPEPGATAVARVAPNPWPRPAVIVPLVVAAVAVPLRTGGEAAGLAHVTLADAVSVLLVLLALSPLLTANGYERWAGDGRLRSPLQWGVFAVLGAATLSTLVAEEVLVALFGYVRTAQLQFCVPLAVVVALRRRTDLWLLLGAFVVVAAAESALGIVQFVTGSGAGFGTENIRAVGTFGAYEILALAAVATSGLVIAVAVALCSVGVTRRWALGAAPLCAGGVALSLSRGFWLATIIAVFVALVAAGRHRLAAVLAISVALVLAAVLSGVITPGGTLGERLDSATEAVSRPDQSLLDRYALWGAATAMWSDAPLLGVGLKGFERHRDRHTTLGFSGLSDIADSAGFRRVELLTPHNRYLLILAEQGLVGLAAFVLLYGGALIAALRRLGRRTDSGVVRAFGVAMVAVTTVDLISWLSDDGAGALAVVSAVALGGLLWFASGVDLQEARQ